MLILLWIFSTSQDLWQRTADVHQRSTMHLRLAMCQLKCKPIYYRYSLHSVSQGQSFLSFPSLEQWIPHIIHTSDWIRRLHTGWMKTSLDQYLQWPSSLSRARMQFCSSVDHILRYGFYSSTVCQFWAPIVHCSWWIYSQIDCLVIVWCRTTSGKKVWRVFCAREFFCWLHSSSNREYRIHNIGLWLPSRPALDYYHY